MTGRVLYTDPNAQGIDKKKTDEFRRCVKAEDGRAIVKGDFAQQELRIAAYYSKDKNMLETFANGEDIYLKTAAKLVGKPVDKDHPARQAAKRDSGLPLRPRHREVPPERLQGHRGASHSVAG